MSVHKRWASLASTLLCAGVLVVGVIGAPSAFAGGSDDPTPYTVSASGVTLPAGTTFQASGHVNYRATALDGSNEQSFGVHFDPNNKQPGGRFIGQSFFGFTNYPATSQYGAITRSAASTFPDGYCITWLQSALYPEHFGEGGQAPVCTGTPPPPDTKVTATAPTNLDKCGTADDTYTIPSKTGVKYLVGGTEKAAGTYSGTGTVVVTAQATPSYKLEGTSSWTFTFTDVACPITVVINPSAPPVEVDCHGNGTVTFDNTKSTVPYSFEVVINNVPKLYPPVAAGEEEQVSISGANPGSQVIVQDDTGPLATATVPDVCDDSTPPPSDDKTPPPNKEVGVTPTPTATPSTPSTNTNGALPNTGGPSVLTGLVGFLLIGLGLVVIRRRKSIG